MEIDVENRVRKSSSSISARSNESSWIILFFYTCIMKYEHPWVWLEIILDNLDISQKEFAELIWKSPVEVNQIISWKRPITLDRAMKICGVFRWKPKTQLDMQADYDEQEYKKSQKYAKILEIKRKAKHLISA